MGYTLVVAEKPSVAKDIAKILGATWRKEGYYQGNQYIVINCIGHLVELCKPDSYGEEYIKWNTESLPIIPKKFKKQVIKKVSKQFYLVKKLMNDPTVDTIINACDSGIEGNNIFDLCYEKAECKKQVYRLWIQSMTDEAILEGMNLIKPYSEYENLSKAGKCRMEADWLIGLNGTRLFTVKYGEGKTLLPVGRVLSPTLTMIVKRQEEIDNFKSKPFYQLKADLNGFYAMWFDEEQEENDRIYVRKVAEYIQRKCSGQIGTVIKAETKLKTENRPELFDLTELQREGNRRYGYTASEVLKAAQRLYEVHKITTYPRTDSQYLTEDMRPLLEPLLKNIKENDRYELTTSIDKILKKGLNIDERIIDNHKVHDHHAIIPTPNIKDYDLSKLNPIENHVLEMILKRFIIALAEKHEYEETTLIIKVDNETFKAKGKKVIKTGWKEIEQNLFKKLSEEDEENTDTEQEQDIPNIQKGQKIKIESIEILNRITKPPKPYTEDTLLNSMKNIASEITDKTLKEQLKDKGIGTPATRSGIIENLVKYKYVIRKKKKLIPTELAKKIVNVLPEQLKSPVTTAKWEYQLKEIEKGKKDPESFMAEIKKEITNIVNEYKEKTVDSIGFTKDNTTSEKEIIGKCPICGRNVFESAKNYYCEGFKEGCKFSIWKNNKYFETIGKKLTKTMVKNFLKDQYAIVKLKNKKTGQMNDVKITMTVKDNCWISFSQKKLEKAQ